VSSYLSQVVKSTHLAPFDEHFFSVELHPKWVVIIPVVISEQVSSWQDEVASSQLHLPVTVSLGPVLLYAQPFLDL
jgi:hypothetical protein